MLIFGNNLIQKSKSYRVYMSKVLYVCHRVSHLIIIRELLL